MGISKRFARKLSYANVVSTLALFLALGGVSYAAATLPKNSVGSKQIKKNAVTTAKIKKNAVTGKQIKTATITGSDVKGGSITGDKLNVGTLGTVPSASTATDTFIVNKRMDASAQNDDVPTARSNATEVPLYSSGNFSFYGKCFYESDATKTYSEIYVRSAVDGALATFYENPTWTTRIDTTSSESDRLVGDVTASSDTQNADFGYDADYISGTDGTGLMFSSVEHARSGTPADASPVFTSDKSCILTLRGAKFAG